MTDGPPRHESAATADLSGWDHGLTDPQTIGRYRIIEPLGEGSSKRVFRARDELLERDVALAVIAGPSVRGPSDRRTLREARTAARLGDHPHIVTLHDVGETDGVAYLVSQLVRGGSVAQRLAERTPSGLPLAETLRIAGEVTDALAHAHEQGVIHRDVKPGNVLLTPDGVAMLTDFGVALLTDRSRTTVEGGVIGSAAYISPEQALGREVDARSDLYSLGATLYELSCGRTVFEGDVLAVLTQHVHSQPLDPRSVDAAVPDGLAALILQLLAKRPEDRPQSAVAVTHALAEIETSGGAGPARAAGTSLPVALAEHADRPFVGREPALASLHEGWTRADEGRPSLRLLVGEPGIGKTRLAAAFAREIAEGGGAVVYGRCDEDPLISYQPFVEALRALIAGRPGLEAAVDPRLEPELAELSRLVPELRGQSTTGAAPAARESERYLLFETVVALLEAGAQAGSLLLVLDDLHWADRPTVLLLRQLLRTPSAHVMVLATARAEGLEAEHPLSALLSDLGRQDDPSRMERLTLSGLDAAETAALVDAREERPVVDVFVRLLHEETGGNPFFIEEALRALRGADLSQAGEAASALSAVGVPEGAREVIQRRLDRLSPEAAELLRSASVCGREFTPEIVAELVGRPVVQLLGRLDEAMAAGLVLEPVIDTFTFCHALVRETLYLGIASDTHRARLHLAVGEALEKLGAGRTSPAELALHFHAGRAVGGAEKAAGYARDAARAAASALSYEEAAIHTARELDALEVLGPERDHERGRILHSLGRLHWQSGDRAAAQRTFLREAELARQLDDADQLARAALGFGGRYYDAEHVDAVLIGLLEEALTALPPGDGPVRAEVMARLADALHFTDPEGRAVGLSAEAVEMGRRSGRAAGFLRVLGARHSVLLHSAHVRERLAITTEWLELAEAMGHHDETALALNWHIYDLVESGDGDGAREGHRRLTELADFLRQPQYLNFATSWEVNWLQIAGRFAEVEPKAFECYGYGRRAQGTYAKSLFAGQLFALRDDQGRLAELAPVLVPLVGENPTLSAWRASMLKLRLATGDLDRVRADLADLCADDCAAIPADGFWLGAMCRVTEACAAVGETRYADGLVAHLSPHADLNIQVGLAFCLGPVARYLGLAHGLAGHTEEAERCFLAAIERSTALGAATAEARARCEYGALLLTAGRDEGRAQLERALATADRLGMAGLRQRATDALAGGSSA
jgi:hypothetical protein